MSYMTILQADWIFSLLHAQVSFLFFPFRDSKLGPKTSAVHKTSDLVIGRFIIGIPSLYLASLVPRQSNISICNNGI